MLPSSTVENYLKALFHHQVGLAPDALVPMGQLAAALGVAPGTATTMVKALADSGLVHYEPYAGVRLSAAGEKLAAMVLRRHRLIELFLVQVMGMDWSEVHDEAEQLEHAVSDRLIERIDDMLGHPAVDPHGDPIPDPEGTVKHPQYYDLLTCPLDTPLVVTRVSDQDAGFLRFIESSELKPGQTIEIEARDPAADAVHVLGRDRRRITLGTRAASKLLVRVARLTLLWVALAGGAQAQVATQPAPPADEPFAILDNSFLVEEAFNQEAGIFQNIFGFTRSNGGDWEASFTQEWPAPSEAHQLSFTIPALRVNGTTGWCDVAFHYRYQALREGPGRPAFAPRVSLIVPTGDQHRGHGAGVVGWQVNLPVSKQLGHIYWHGNAGFTYLPGVETAPRAGGVGGASKTSLFSPHLAASAIVRVRPMVHVMLEGLVEFEEGLRPAGATIRDAVWTVSPGLRAGWNVGTQQVVAGVAAPVTISGGEADPGVLAYLSYELPFAR